MSKRPGDPGYPATWCIHFRSRGQHDTCEAGIRYDSLPPKMALQPCFTDSHLNPDVGACSSCRLPTAEEIAAHEVWIQSRMVRLGTVFTGIAPWLDEHKGRDAAAVLECPYCKGRLHVSVAGCNGHSRGRCETPGCVSWMQ